MTVVIILLVVILIRRCTCACRAHRPCQAYAGCTLVCWLIEPLCTCWQVNAATCMQHHGPQGLMVWYVALHLCAGSLGHGMQRHAIVGHAALSWYIVCTFVQVIHVCWGCMNKMNAGSCSCSQLCNVVAVCNAPASCIVICTHHSVSCQYFVAVCMLLFVGVQ